MANKSPPQPLPPMKRFAARSTCAQILDGISLEGKVIMITGTTSGIGVPTAKYLALAGAHVIIANRNAVLSRQQIQEIKNEKPDAKVDFIYMELSSLQKVVDGANEFRKLNLPLHVLILNAGVFYPDVRATTDNFESTFGINHLAHFTLITQLIDILEKSSPSRIVILTSKLHGLHGMKRSFDVNAKVAHLCPPPDTSHYGYKLYSLSKCCNILTAKKLHRMYNDKGISTYAVHPGAGIYTSIGRTFGIFIRLGFKIIGWFSKNIDQGAATTVLCAARPEVDDISGHYWQDCKDAENAVDSFMKDEQLQDALYDHSMELIKKCIKQ